MFISDLNFLQTTEENVAGGSGRRGSRFNYDKYVDVKVEVKYDVYKEFKTDVDIDDNLATADAVAQAYGDNSLAETESFTYADDYYTESFSGSSSAVD